MFRRYVTTNNYCLYDILLNLTNQIKLKWLKKKYIYNQY